MVDLTTVAFVAAAEPNYPFQSALRGARRARMKSIPSRDVSVWIPVQVRGII